MTRHGATIVARLRQQRRWQLMNDTAALLLASVAATALALVVTMALFWSGWVLVAVAVVPAGLGWRWLRGLALARIARDAEARFDELRGRLVAAFELTQSPARSREGYSVELTEAAVEQAAKLLQPVRLERLVRRQRLARAGIAAAVALGLFAAYLVAMPDRARLGLANAFAPGQVRIGFAVSPGDTAVLPGRTVPIGCRVEPSVFGAVRFVAPDAPGGSRRLRVREGRAEIELKAESGFEYRFQVLGRSSPTYHALVLEPLRIERLEFVHHYPPHTGLPDYRSTSTELTVLRGTVVDFSGRTNGPVGRGRFVLGPETLALSLGPGNEVSGRFNVRDEGEARFELAAPGGDEFQLAATARVRTLGDEAPLVRLLVPGRDVDMPVSMQLLLVVNSLDDFGLGDLELLYGRDSATERLRIKRLSGREDTTFYSWDLSDLGLLPGDELGYHVAVTDNDAVSGPKRSRTRDYRVRFPTMTEIYNAAVRQTEYTAEELAPLMEEQDRLTEEVARIGDQLKRTGDLSWEEQRALEQLMAEQVDLAHELAELGEEVGQLMDEMFQGAVLDQETMQQLGRLQQLLSELLPRELQESLARLREQLDAGGEELAALERFEVDQEELKAAIEQALEMLDRIVEEQRLEALARKAEELAETEQDIVAGLEEAATTDELAALQEGVGEGLDSLLAELAELAESMSDADFGDSLAGLAARAADDSLPAMAAEAGQQLRQGDRRRAGEQAGQLQQKLSRMAQALGSLAEALKARRSAEVAGRLVAIAEELLAVVAEQEALEAMPDSLLLELAPREMSLHDATGVAAESLVALAGRTLALPGDAGDRLVGSMIAMQDAAQKLVERQARNSRSQMAAARAGVVGVVGSLLRALEQASSGASGGLEGLMQALSQMTAEQMAINAGMAGIPMPLPGGMSSSQLQALSRLLSRQRALREKLQQMLEQLGGSQPGLTGSLDNLVEEMERVEQDLERLNVTRELVERQESILSHLLDAQRSVQQRGYREQRESEAARPFEVGPSPRLPADWGERNRMLREELMRALRRGGMGEYEQMIRRYFERLLESP